MLKASRKEQHSVICFLWAKGLCPKPKCHSPRDASSIWWQVFYKTINTRLV